MLALAVSELDLSPDVFWELTWYDWSLYLHKLDVKRESDKLKQELEWDRFRSLFTVISNHTPKKAGTPPSKPTDWMRLSFDNETEKKESEPLTPDQVEKRFGKSLKEKINYGE